MRRSLTKFPYPVIGRATCPPISSAFSTSSSGGGAGRGGSTPFQFTVDESQPNNSKQEDASPVSHGHGRGRGQTLPSSPLFSPVPNNDPNHPPHGRGRGFIPSNYPSPPQEESESPKPNAKMPFLFMKDKASQDNSPESGPPIREPKTLPGDIINVLSGAGRGKTGNIPAVKPKAENRHIRQRPPPQPRPPARSAAATGDGASVDKSSPKVQLSQDEKVKMAVGILSKGDEGGGGGRGEASGTHGGRGRGRGRGRGGGRGTWMGNEEYGESHDEDDRSDGDEDLSEFGVGDDADGEKLAEKLGPEKMSDLAEAFEIAVDRVLPDPEGFDDDLLDALHTNYLIECEPEYRMEEFGTNPDIDDKPPIPLREAFEKMKPFLMAYEGIQSHEEWEEIIEATMKTVPLMKKIVDDYGGPDRVTAKQQIEELERVAKTLPGSAPASVKRFTDRAVLSLQSNPGWGWDKKCQFMDKLVLDVSQQYK